MPSDRCLFCDKNRLTKNREEEKLVKCVTKTSEESIKAAAESKQDDTILLKVRGVNLVAKEAHYHNSCRKEYTRPSKQRSGIGRGNQSEIEAAHQAAFDHVCDFVGESIISGLNVARMSTLRERYCWDNFDLKETPSGAGTTHTAHGIIIQEVTDIDQDSEADVFNVHDEVSKTKRRPIQCTSEHYEPCFAKEKTEPKLRVTNSAVGKTQAESQAKPSDVVWVICRALTSSGPTMGWMGF